MPITLPGISVTEAGKYLQIQDKLLRTFPEVASVYGKIGKSETATDPAPLSMVETTVVLKPENEWRKQHVERWYSSWAPEFTKQPLRRFWPEQQPIGWESLIEEMDKLVQIPSFANAWLFPIRTRIDMITTGIRTPVGVKVLGPQLETIEKIGLQVERVLQQVPQTRSAFFERVTGGYYLDFQPKREQAARYNLSVGALNDIIESAIGGQNVTTTIQGRERYPVNVRYARGLRDNVSALSRVLVPTPDGAQVPLIELAQLSIHSGAPMIKNEEGFLAGFIYVDTTTTDLGGYVESARRAGGGTGKIASWLSTHLERPIRIPAASGSAALGGHPDNPFHRLPASLLQYRFPGEDQYHPPGRAFFGGRCRLVCLPAWLQHEHRGLGGVIALLGVDAETGVFMLLYLDLAYNERVQKGQMKSMADLREAIEDGP